MVDRRAKIVCLCEVDIISKSTDIIQARTHSHMKINTDENVSPSFWRSFNKSLHSERKVSAPVRLPSPPMTHRLVIPRFTRLWAARSRPSRSRKSLHRALPITVPPCRGEVEFKSSGNFEFHMLRFPHFPSDRPASPRQSLKFPTSLSRVSLTEEKKMVLDITVSSPYSVTHLRRLLR